MTTDCYHAELQFQGEKPRRRQPKRRNNHHPLLTWADAQPLPIAARYIQRLTGDSASVAMLKAELAGLSITGERRNG